MSSIFGGHYRLKNRVGAGSFGEVFEAEDTKMNIIVGLKIEPAKTHSPQLEHESDVYRILQDGVNIPRFFSFECDEKYNYMSMEIMGKSLEELFYICNKKFTLKTVLMIIDQTLNVIEFVHRMKYIYRDVKPNNFLMGKDFSANQVILIDFGLAKKYIIDDETNEHVHFKEDQAIVGTARYLSPNALMGNQQSRKDDMIALAYLWIFFLKGTLPWVGLEDQQQGGSIDSKYDKVIAMKKSIAPEELCADLPAEFTRYLAAVKSLKFEEEPKYAEYRLLFRKLFMRYNFQYDYKYDWTGNPLVEPPPPPPKLSARSSARKNRISSRLLPPTMQTEKPPNPYLNLTAHHKRAVTSPGSFSQRGLRSDDYDEDITANDADDVDSNQSAKRSSATNSCKIRQRGKLEDFTTPKKVGMIDKSEPHIRVSPPLPRQRVRPPRPKFMSMTLKDVYKIHSDDESESKVDSQTPPKTPKNGISVDDLGPVKPPLSLRPKNASNAVPIIPNLSQVLRATEKAKSARSNSKNVKSNSFNEGKSLLPAIQANEWKKSPDPLSKALFSDFLGKKW